MINFGENKKLNQIDVYDIEQDWNRLKQQVLVKEDLCPLKCVEGEWIIWILNLMVQVLFMKLK